MYVQGRCRICEKLFCCATHRNDHETKVHKNQLEIIKHFPAICKICHRMMNTLCDLKSNCVVVGTSMHKHKLIRKTTEKRLRKRTISQSTSGCVIKNVSHGSRKIIKPSIKYRKMKLARTLNTITDLHGQVSSAIIININTQPPIEKSNMALAISPEFDLNTPEANLLKNSTPLLKQSEVSCETYHTPATQAETPLKGIISSCKYGEDTKYRKVTFDVRNENQTLPLVSMTSSCNAIEYSSYSTTSATSSYITPLAITNEEPVSKNEMFSRFFIQMQSVIQGICNAMGFYRKNDSSKRLHSELKSIENVCDARDTISSPPNKKICIRPLNHSGRPLYTRSPLPRFLTGYKDKLRMD